MSEAQIGHNKLREITDRINNLEDQKKEIANDIRDLYSEAGSSGYNPKALREIVRRQRADAEKLAQFDADVETYMAALNMLVGS